jgi:hypothetical protein
LIVTCDQFPNAKRNFRRLHTQQATNETGQILDAFG